MIEWQQQLQYEEENNFYKKTGKVNELKEYKGRREE